MGAGGGLIQLSADYVLACHGSTQAFYGVFFEGIIIKYNAIDQFEARDSLGMGSDAFPEIILGIKMIISQD